MPWYFHVRSGACATPPSGGVGQVPFVRPLAGVPERHLVRRSFFYMNSHETRIDLQKWADKYHSRIDQDLTNAWPVLKERLRDLVDEMSLWELVLGPGTDFRDNRLSPTIESWAKANVMPIVEAAEKELQRLIESIRVDRNDPYPDTARSWEGNWRFSDAGGPALAAIGAGAGLAGLVLGISKITTFLIFTTLIVNWYLVIAGIVIGAVLFAYGSHRALSFKAELRDRFRKLLLPKIEETILGNSFELEGKTILSVRCQLKETIDREKAAALHRLEEGNV